jgi:pyruvate/2-oxoglutarate dehydrogenase complex dihydrolipoamide acyltransferase (E2) component
MRYEVKVESLGDGVESAVFATWIKQVGESVEAGEPIAELMTDKVNLEIEAPVAGVLVEQKVEAEENVALGQTIALIDGSSS